MEYEVRWLDINGNDMVKKGFATSEEAHDWIKTHNFDMDFEQPMVFCVGK